MLFCQTISVDQVDPPVYADVLEECLNEGFAGEVRLYRQTICSTYDMRAHLYRPGNREGAIAAMRAPAPNGESRVSAGGGNRQHHGGSAEKNWWSMHA